METKTIAEWEYLKDRIVMGLAEADAQQQVTEDEFNAILPELMWTVNWDARNAFLTDNQYELSRENMYNQNLSVRPSDLWEA